MASNNIMQQWPATMAFDNFMQQWPPTADVILRNNGLQQYYATMASNCRCNFMQQWPPTILCNSGLQLQM